MTNRRLAVTSRSAAVSSPARARRASRFSSSGSVIMGSFWMSRRYWSNEPDGLDRSKARAFPVRTWAIITLDGGCRDGDDVVGGQVAERCDQYRVYREEVKQIRISTSQ